MSEYTTYMPSHGSKSGKIQTTRLSIKKGRGLRRPNTAALSASDKAETDAALNTFVEEKSAGQMGDIILYAAAGLFLYFMFGRSK